MTNPAPLLALTGFLPAWDLEKRSADVTPIIAWLLRRLREIGHDVERLDDLHLFLNPAQALAASRACTVASLDGELRGLVCRAVREALPEIDAHPIWLQTRTHFRILVPDDQISPVPPHTDFGFGHGLDERNIWFSLTNAHGKASLHAISLSQSLAYISQTNSLYGLMDRAPEPQPITTNTGDVLLFTPLHVHCARMPEANQCRVSFDVRIIPAPVSPRDLTFSPLERP